MSAPLTFGPPAEEHAWALERRAYLKAELRKTNAFLSGFIAAGEVVGGKALYMAPCACCSSFGMRSAFRSPVSGKPPVCASCAKAIETAAAKGRSIKSSK